MAPLGQPGRFGDRVPGVKALPHVCIPSHEQDAEYNGQPHPDFEHGQGKTQSMSEHQSAQSEPNHQDDRDGISDTLY